MGKEILDDELILKMIPQRPAYVSKMRLLHQLKSMDYNLSPITLAYMLDKLSDLNLITISPLSNLVIGIKDLSISRK